jgi:Arc/MetJ-type ribon-helix-helix transcriptional regulator
MTYQLALRIPDKLAKELDMLVSNGRFATRTEAVRSAINDLVERERRAGVGEAVAAGYRQVPETDEELETAEQNLRRLISEEPW